MIEAAAALLAWSGAAVIVLSDGRRGLALGLGLLTVGLAALEWGDWLAVIAIFGGGTLAAWRRLRSGRPGWGLMPPGSTPRMVLCVAAGLVALWVAVSVTTGPGVAVRFATLTVIGLMTARVLAGSHTTVVLTAVSALALAMAAATGLGAMTPGPAPFIIGALIAAGVTVVPLTEPRAA